MRRNRPLDYLVYLAVRIVICVIQALRIETCQTVGRWLAYLCCDVLRVRQAVVDDNLQHAFPNLSETARRRMAHQMWEHLFLLLAEIAHAPRKIHDSNWRDYITPANPKMLVGALLEERATVLVSGHYGNFELCGFLLGVFGYPTYTIARPLDNVYLDRFLNQFRGARGQHILPKQGSAKRIDALLASGGTLSLLGDQHAGNRGCWVNFFGRPASTNKAIALFSLANDVPLLVGFSRRIGGPLKHTVGVDAMVDPRSLSPELANVPALTQWYTNRLEQLIRRAPEQYWWLHRRWKDERPPDRAQTNKAA